MGYPGDESRRSPYHSPDTPLAPRSGSVTGPLPRSAADAYGGDPAWPAAAATGSSGPSWGGGQSWGGSPDPYAPAADPYGASGASDAYGAQRAAGPLGAPADDRVDLFRPARPARSADPYGAPDPFAARAPRTEERTRPPYGGTDAWGAHGDAAGGPPPAFRPATTPPSFGAGRPDDRPGGSAADEADRSAEPPAAKPPRRPKAWVRPVIYSTAAVVLLGAAGGGLYAVAQRNATPPPSADPSPTASAHVGLIRPQGKYGFAASRKTDPTPLTAKELFPRLKITSGGRTYLMRARRTDKVCKNAVVGEKIQKAVQAAKCTQLIRASFQDSSGKIIGTIGVANLGTSAGARRVASAGAAKERKDYVKPLQGKSGATKSLGTGEALAGAWTHGHYAVLLWFQFKDGHKPSAAETKRLNRAATDIADKTVFPALDTRSLTGAPG